MGSIEAAASISIGHNDDAISPNKVRRWSNGHDFRRPRRECIEVRVRHRTVFDLQSVDVLILGCVSNREHAIRSYADHRGGARF